ncbi:MAG: DEAD/DEAH box helicase [Promicromonosporaceae bacterium]|nr:DEAD/DEAH box helicase [Promicromonosporaceae bacterium]
MTAHLAEFTAGLGFALDDFQTAACEALDAGRGVLVAAPTGAGKTVVAEFACHLALARGGRAFYTTPIKALSNQKYRDLVARHGAEKVGLLTGDTAINGEAPVVVMTTEVLRNMLYTDADRRLDDLRFVIMDEVHYLADRFRGPVWEEVIIHLPAAVQVVSLSATVSNAEEFGDWLQMVRGDTEVIVSERRPVPLWQHIVVSATEPRGTPRLLDLYADVKKGAGERSEAPTSGGAPANPPLSPEVIESFRRLAKTGGKPGDRGFRGPGGRRIDGRKPGPSVGGGSARRYPPRAATVEALHQAKLLPAIYFIFSRAGCEGAVNQCLQSGLRLTSAQEEAKIRAEITEAVADIGREDLDVLGFWSWSQALSRGIAAHHAGLLPVFKETVERLFARGLIKVVFATETLALGINMPAKSVALEKLAKFDGVSVRPVTPGEYTQLTGRAGRRGIDPEGHAVVIDHRGLDPVALAGLASRRTYPLKSSFRPTYNMAVNLVATVGHRRALEVLETSFAQFQADRSVVHLAQQAQTAQLALAEYDVDKQPYKLQREYRRLVKRIEGQTGSVARTFDRTCQVLTELGYLTRVAGQARNTTDGDWLRRIYTENDLLLAESLRQGVLDELDPASLAALVSAIVYEGRREATAEPAIPGGPHGRIGQGLAALEQVWRQVTDLETRHGLDATGDLDAGIVAPIHRWASGRGLAATLRGTDLAAGDLVRWCKQVLDVLEQLTRAAPTAKLQATAHRAVSAMWRGVVAHSGL